MDPPRHAPLHAGHPVCCSFSAWSPRSLEYWIARHTICNLDCHLKPRSMVLPRHVHVSCIECMQTTRLPSHGRHRGYGPVKCYSVRKLRQVTEIRRGRTRTLL